MKVIVVGILLASAIGAVWYYAFPAWDRVVAARRELSAIRDIEKKAEDIKSKRDAIIDRFNSIDKEKKARLDELVPAALAEEDLFVFLNKVITESGMKFEGVGIAALGDDAAGGRKTTSFDVKASGPYSSFRGLLNTLESNSRLIDIDTIGITEDARGVFSLAVRGKMYYAQ